MLWPRIRRNRAKGGGYTGQGNQGPAGIVHPAEFYFRDKETAERWKLTHPEAHVYYSVWVDGYDIEDWREV